MLPEFVIRRACEFREIYGAEIMFEGAIPDRNKVEWTIAIELILNCVTNRVPGKTNAGASKVFVLFEPGKLTVKDDFKYPNPNRIVGFLNKVVASDGFLTTKPIGTMGGTGIRSITDNLKSVDGSLTYHEEEGTIVAVAEWDSKKEFPY